MPSFEERLAGGDPLLRWAAAIALARLGNSGPAVVGALAEATANPPDAARETGPRCASWTATSVATRPSR